ncbi:AIPR family protein [Desulfopila sp. IMCC35008]|uniref:AIPR family protein n=1 Tax=Desulfopila sp. IMCC35008 TaxID=2653858 RepID=UPI0013D601DA|nr:AIPR family protein [Desulfopila sp. IMCC35008]
MDRITSSLLKTFSEDFEIAHLSADKQFEHFTNYCVVSKHYRGSFEVDTIHSGGGNDCGIDGLCLIVNGRQVTDEDELEDIVETSGHLDADIIFIQSKTSSSFNGSDIGTFIHGIKDFISETPQLEQNSTIKRFKLIWEKLISMSSHMVNRLPNCQILYACTGKWVGDRNLTAIIKSGVEEIEQSGLFDSIVFTPLGAQEVQRLYRETQNKLSSTIKFESKITLPDINGISESYLGILPFTEYLKLIQDENRTIYNIFDDNIRDFQGPNAVNNKIQETLENKEYDLFCVLNNGVTVVAGSITPAANRFTIRDYQVVNGCQTSNVLHACQDFQEIDNVSIPIRIIVTDNDEVKTKITLATNSQTEVKTEQLEALNAFQKKLELHYMAEHSSRVKLYYERRSQQYNSIAGIKKTQIISIPIQIKCFASMFLESPHLVSAYYGTIVKRFAGKIFASDHLCVPYYVSALCYFRLEQFFRSGDIDSSLKKARFLIMLLVRLLSMGKDIAPFNSKRLEKDCDELKDILTDEDKALELIASAVGLLLDSGINLDKNRYKTESDTETVLKAYTDHMKSVN